MTFTQHIIYIFASFFPMIWIFLVGSTNTLPENILLALGGSIASLFLYLQGVWNNRKTKTLLLQHVKVKLNGDMVLLSHQETIQLDPQMKYFIKQPRRIQNGHNNIEGLSQYKVREKMMRKLDAI